MQHNLLEKTFFVASKLISTMAKLPYCDCCRYYSHDFRLVCALHPTGPIGDSCPDLIPDPNLEGKRFIDFLSLQQQDREDSESYSNPFNLELNEDLWQSEDYRSLYELRKWWKTRACH